MKKILVSFLLSFAWLIGQAQTFPVQNLQVNGTSLLTGALTANGGMTLTNGFTATGLVTTTDLAVQAANTILANATGSSASPTAITVTGCNGAAQALQWTNGTGFGCNSSIATSGANANITSLSGLTTPLSTGQGGTGTGSMTQYNVAVGGSGSLAYIGPSTSGFVLTSNGASSYPSFQSIPWSAPPAIGNVTPNSGAFTSLSATSAPTLGAATFFPTVPTNAALTALSTATTSAVTRLGFYAAGDAPPIVYIASASACSLNAGAGDNGSQVQSANGKCWIPAIPMAVADVREWGAAPDGVTDDTTEIQAAINSGIRSIYIPSGTYLITNTLNLTNLASTGVPLKIYGDEVQYNHGATNAGSIILARTAGAHSGWIADLTGTEFTTIQDIYFLASGTNASTKGLLYARSTLANFAQNNTLRRVIINIPSAVGASTVGSIAVANNCAEEFVIEQSWLQADTPLLSTLANEVSLTSPYATIANTTFSNTKYSIRDTTLEPILFSGVIAYGLASANFDNVTIIPVTAFTYPYAITLRSSASGYLNNENIKITGQVESFASVLRIEGNTSNIDVGVSTSNVTGNNVSFLAGTSHQNFKYHPNPLNNANVNEVLSTGASVTLYGGEIVMPTTMTLIDSNLILSGTSIVGGNNDLSSGSVFSVNAASSYRPRWANDYTHYSATINPGAITTGTSFGTSFAAANVRLTDKVSFAAPYDLQGTVATATVLSNGNIRVTIINLTGSTITLGSGTWRFWVERPTF